MRVQERITFSLNKAVRRAAGPPDALLGCRDVFSPELASNEVFRRALIEAVTQLKAGARAAIENANLKTAEITSASGQNL
ncbi:hypothetical protein SBC1_39740 (plasmid) [Caballeronia sp. SBC1]|uniref:hypothetical protein n=1 Tax=unclassified Caballeronia TaxID=2646786 RepID=UPI0013E9ECDA|nr:MULTISPECIES: hypothetical protein [unclassified Caballeronia]QIN63934.1 hypothetical protein SBC1_39740 [Caballeronia sp. SBC1]